MAQSHEKQLIKQRQQVTTLENKIGEQSTKIEQIDELRTIIQGLEEENESSMKEKDEISLECDDMKRHAAELVEKVKNQVEGNEFLIDRRMINTFLV